MCVYLYIRNTYTQYTHICYCKQTFLDVINRLTALIYLFITLFNTGKHDKYTWEEHYFYNMDCDV